MKRLSRKIGFRSFDPTEKEEAMNYLKQALQQRFPKMTEVQEAEFTSGYDLDAVEVKPDGRREIGMFGGDSSIIMDIFNDLQDKYVAQNYGQQGRFGFRITKREETE